MTLLIYHVKEMVELWKRVAFDPHQYKLIQSLLLSELEQYFSLDL